MNKDLRNTLAWIVCATGIMGAAIWQAQVSIALDLKARNQSLPPPLKTRFAIRPPTETWAGDPVADYIARCEKGLTDQEIGWIIEDFQNAGLDIDITTELSWAELFNLRSTQHRWYHDALVDGLRLSSEQSAEVTGKLSELFDLAKADFVEASGRPQLKEINGIWIHSSDSLASDLTSASAWLMNLDDPYDPQADMPDYKPWNLCSLTQDQQQITWKSLYDIDTNASAEDLQDSNASLDTETMRHQDGLEFLLSYPTISGGSLSVREYLSANFIFPFSKHQSFPTDQDLHDKSGIPLLPKVRLLHPAQLKTLLLFNPTWAGKIQLALNSASP
jgi:hypothetical protein